jgi:hypothetical protein
MMYPLVRELAADGIPVAVTCRVLGLTPQGHCKWRSDAVCDRDWDDAHLVDRARDIHADAPVFGYRFISAELAAEDGIKASENRVHRLCCAHDIFLVLARRNAASQGQESRWTTTWSAEPSGRPLRTGCGSPPSPSTRRPRASSTCVP